MKMKSIVTGITVCAAAGTVAYAMTTASSRDKKMLKSRAGKALHAIGEVAEGISQIMG